jgi:hypothetical protein
MPIISKPSCIAEVGFIKTIFPFELSGLESINH